jgi:hypothetical protein
MTDHESLRFTLLDQQLVDADDRPVGRVDDVLLELTGEVMASVASRMRSGEHRAEPVAIPASLIGDHADLVKLTVALGDLPQAAGLERWLAHHLIEGLPGAGDARD